MADLEVAHRMADDILCRLLSSLGYADVVAPNIIKSASGSVPIGGLYDRLGAQHGRR